MYKFLREVRAVVLRKGVTHAEGRLGGHPIGGPATTLAYALEVRDCGEPGKTYTVYLDYQRSRDFYRIPRNRELTLRIGRYRTLPGYWVETWSVEDGPERQDQPTDGAE